MFNRLIIIGAGGHGKVVADIALRAGYTDICFVDNKPVAECMGFKVIGICDDVCKYDDGNTDFVIAIGDNATRRKIAEKYPVNWVSLVHPSAQIGSFVRLGIGTVVMANAVINACATVGVHSIINSAAVVEHDNVLGDYVHISPKAALGGTVVLGNETHIGIGATVRNNLSICEKCVIGAGAVVVSDIVISGNYVGIPAKALN